MQKFASPLGWISSSFSQFLQVCNPAGFEGSSNHALYSSSVSGIYGKLTIPFKFAWNALYWLRNSSKSTPEFSW